MFTIGIFGRRNVGKSSLINALTEQDLAIVSDIPGTTTDPVKKSIELFGIGKSVIIDTAGFDDDGGLGKQRIEKTKQILQTIDFAILVFSENQFGKLENEWLKNFEESDVPFILVHNKCDVVHSTMDGVINVSAKEGTNLQAVFDEIQTHPRPCGTPPPAGDIPLLEGVLRSSGGGISQNNVVILVTPIDTEAPTNRLILPQVQTIRAILDENAIAITCKPEQLQQTLETLKTPPTLVITDSQAFAEVEKIVPKDCRLTSFSILLARQKGDFTAYLKGVPYIDTLKNGDKILILESCTHQSTCEDIARVKLPNLLKKHTKKELHFEIISGLSPIPNNIETYAMVFQCGACMITQKQLHNRLKPFIGKGIPTTNFGMAFAFLTGIFDRATNFLK